jgi:hypothetical protein
MSKSQHNLSRRQTLVGVGLAAVAASAPVVGASMAKARQPDRGAWNAAVAAYEAADAEMNRVSDIMGRVHAEAEKACPDEGQFTGRYGMSYTWANDRNYRAAHFAIVIERSQTRLLTDAEAEQASDDAKGLANEFDAYRERRCAAFAPYDRVEDQFDGLVDAQCEARRKLLETPAPDGEALLYKLDLLASFLETADSEDAHSIDLVRNDARRVLTVGRA